MIRSHKLTLRISIPIIAIVVLFAIIIPLFLFSTFSGDQNIDEQKAERAMTTIQHAYCIITGLALIGLSGLISYIYRVDMRINQAYTMFEQRIEEQAGQLTLLNDFFTREVAEHKREQLEFQLINRMLNTHSKGLLLQIPRPIFSKLILPLQPLPDTLRKSVLGKIPAF